MPYLTQHICHIFKQLSHSKSVFLVAIPLILSAFTHLWNPTGFPAVWVVEGQYIHRTMHILEGFGHHHEESSIYPHPYFGQYFLAGMLAVAGYPGSLHLSSSTATDGDIMNSIKMLYFVPSVLTGLLAVVDTLLVFKIAEHKYNVTAARRTIETMTVIVSMILVQKYS